jgi:hypothetical protein
MSEVDNKPAWFVNTNSYISVGIVVLIISATVWLNNGQAQSRQLANDVKNELEHYKEIQKLNADLLGTKLDNLTELYKTGNATRFTYRDHEIFVDRLQELNPQLKVPKSK